MQILGLDISGTPFRWLEIEQAARYVAHGKVAWEIGEPIAVLHGGTQRVSGLRSELAIPPVIAIAKSEGMVRYAGPIPLGSEDNALLYKRDRGICAYCGEHIAPRDMTRDHVIPRARGGKDVWENVVAAHRHCNLKKGCRLPEEANMPLLFVPYEPCRNEYFILSGRRIIADQMQLLLARVPKHSRLLMT